MKKIEEEVKNRILKLRSQGLSYSKIVESTGVGRTTVIKIIKNDQALDRPIEAKVKKPCPNPRLIIIYFNDVVEDDAKCVVRPGINYPRGKTLLVRKVETSEESLYRIA